MQQQRIQKFLSRVGVASRRTIEDWIKCQRLKVNGQLAVLGMQVTGVEQFILDGQILQVSVRSLSDQTTPNSSLNATQDIHKDSKLLLYHKPVGRICSTNDRLNRPTVFEDLPKISYGKWVSIGRLDINTSGLLLFTNDGDLAHKFMHPNFNQEREYLVRAYGTEITLEQLSLLTEGVLLSDGIAKCSKIALLNSNLNSHKITRNKSHSCNNWYKIVLTEGRNREVRRLFATQNLVVNRLIRIRFGNIVLPKNLKPREYKFINLSENNK